ncbi:PH domain-containing protein [Timonella sp. A28]|uniref:PH domain-containing protein n=1 Tax=Timonella sp. A28 TaxID=3442640 RepID=UPI003EBD860D
MLPHATRSELGAYESTYTPRFLRVVCVVAALSLTVGLGIILWKAPGISDGHYDATNTFAMLGAWSILMIILWRFGRARVTIYTNGITVHNFFRNYILLWPMIFSCTLKADDSWAIVDLTTGKRITVLALARSEGHRTLDYVKQLQGRLDRYDSSNDSSSSQ